MKILITGGSGFIGRHITQKLIEDGHEVTIISTGSEPKIDGVHKIMYMGLDGIDWDYFINRMIRDQEKVDVVFHQMANNDTRCVDEREMRLANNIGPMKLFNTMQQCGCNNFIYASSTAVYGSQPAPYIEAETKVDPLNVYGQSKADFDEFAMRFAQENKVQVTGLRYCNVYGPGEEHKGKRMSMIGQILRQMLKGCQPNLFDPGTQKRDWIFVKDVVNFNIAALNRTKGSLGEIYNVGSGVAVEFNDIVKVINDLLKTSIEPKYIPCPFSDEYQDFTQCSIEKAKTDLGFFPQYDLRSGITEYLKEFTCAS